jgi:hypothetical protein
MKSGYTPARARGGYGELPGVVLVASGGVGGARKGAEVEDAPKEGPAVGYVGDEDGGAGFTDVPKCPNGAERLREGVVFIEGGAEYLWRSVDGWKVECGVGGTYDEDSKAEETAQDCFPIFQLVWGWSMRTWKMHFRGGSFDVIRRGRGIHNIMRSEEMLKHALVMRWCMAAEHCTVRY